MRHGLVEVMDDPVPVEVDKVVVNYCSRDIESIHIIQPPFNSSCLLEVHDLVKNPPCLVVVIKVLSKGVCNLFSSTISVVVGF